MAAYVHWLGEAAEKYDVKVHGWVLMTNHVHLLMTPHTDRAISRLMQSLGRRYVRYFNYKYARTGTLFEDRFKSSIVQDTEYLLTCLRYIELNPVRAGIVNDPGDYRWSSYRAHAFGVEAAIWVPHSLYLALADNEHQRQQLYRQLVSEKLDVDVIAKIRHCANKGLVLGTEKFRNQFTTLTGDRANNL